MKGLKSFFLIVFLVFFLGILFAGADTKQGEGNNYLAMAKSHHDRQEYEEAIKWYKQAIDADPGNSESYNGIGQVYAKQGRYVEAIKWYKEAIRLNPKDSLAYSGLGWAYRFQGSYPQAIKWFKEGIKIDPKSSHNYNGLGCAYRDQGNYAEASRYFKKTIEISPDDSRGYEGLGRIYYKTQNYPEAIRWLKEAKKFCIDCDPINEAFARVYTAQGEYAKAEEILNSIIKGKSIEQFRYWGCPFQALGELYSHMNISNQKRKALENYMKSADIEKHNSFSQYYAARDCYKYADYENALKYIERAIKLAKGAQSLNEFLILKGYILTSTRKYQEAEAIFKQVLSKGDRMQIAKARVGMGHIEITRHNYKLASEYFQEMLQLDRDDPMANLGMAWINSNQNEHQQALSYYEIVFKNNPFHLLVLLGKGHALMGLKRMPEAEAAFKQVLKIDPENEYAFAELGILAYNKDQDTQAEQLFHSALERNNSAYTCPYEGLGLVYLKQNRIKEAEENFKRAIALNPNIEYKKYNGLSRIYIKQGKIQEAKELLKKSIANYPYDNEAKELLKEIDARAGKR